MIHNGIEHGMMSAIAEAFNIMRDGLGMELDEIADVYEKWNKEGELVCSDVLIQSAYRLLTNAHSKVHSSSTSALTSVERLFRSRRNTFCLRYSTRLYKI